MIPRADAAQTFRAQWTLDEVKTATAFDSSGNGNDGANVDIVGDGAGYTFNGSSSRVVVSSSGSLTRVSDLLVRSHPDDDGPTPCGRGHV